MSLYDLKYWIRGAGLVLLLIGLDLAVSGHAIQRRPVDVALYNRPPARLAIATGLFRDFGVYLSLAGATLLIVSSLDICSWKK